MQSKVGQLCMVSAGFDSRSLSSNCRHRIQRFMADAELPTKLVSCLISNISPVSGKLILVMDRTSWEFGESNIHILMSGVSYRNVAIPLMFWVLDTKSNLNTTECIREDRENGRKALLSTSFQRA